MRILLQRTNFEKLLLLNYFAFLKFNLLPKTPSTLAQLSSLS